MARNIELKARDPNPAHSLEVSLALGATDEGWLQQLDTYFRVADGRLKLREQDESAELIFYERTDEATERVSSYRIVPIPDPDGLKEALAAAVGILVAAPASVAKRARPPGRGPRARELHRARGRGPGRLGPE
jgi:CYTH domain